MSQSDRDDAGRVVGAESPAIFGNPLHETKDYYVVVGEMRLGEWKGQDGYLIVNKRTNLIEGELTVEWLALQTIRNWQIKLEATLENQPDEADISFDEMIARLSDGQGAQAE